LAADLSRYLLDVAIAEVGESDYRDLAAGFGAHVLGDLLDAPRRFGLYDAGEVVDQSRRRGDLDPRLEEEKDSRVQHG
jgi:hypothetical protein